MVQTYHVARPHGFLGHLLGSNLIQPDECQQCGMPCFSKSFAIVPLNVPKKYFFLDYKDGRVVIDHSNHHQVYHVPSCVQALALAVQNAQSVKMRNRSRSRGRKARNNCECGSEAN